MHARSCPVGIGIVGLCLTWGVACKGELQSGLAASQMVDTGVTQAPAGASSPSSAGAPGSSRVDAGKALPDASVAMMDAAPKAGDSGGHDAMGDAAVATGSDSVTVDAQAPEQGDPVIVVVGYLGLRVMSRDLGHSWEHKQTIPDPSNGDLDNPLLLRSVTYANGLFVAAGHRIFTSPDAVTWTERDNPQDQWIGGVQWGNNRFVAAGGYGESWYSLDGLTWVAGGTRSNNSHVRSVAFGNGEFRAANDNGEWWRSENGESWSLITDGINHGTDVAFCNGMFRDHGACGPAFGDGVYIEGGDWDKNVIRYSSDATNWHDVSVEYRGDLRGVAFGFAPPQSQP